MFCQKTAAILYHRSVKVFECRPVPAGHKHMYLHPAATAAGGSVPVSTLKAGGGGPFRHNLWRACLRRGKKPIPGTGSQPAGRAGGLASGAGAPVSRRRVLWVDPRRVGSPGRHDRQQRPLDSCACQSGGPHSGHQQRARVSTH